MAKLLFLLHCLCITTLYTLIKYTYIHLVNFSTLEIAGYMNIGCLVLLLPYAVKNIKKIIKSFGSSVKLSTSVLSSSFKMIAISDVSPRNTIVMSFLQPIFIVIFSFLFLGEYESKNKKKFYYIFLSLIGACVFVGKFEIENHKSAYFFVLIHIVLKAITSIFIKKTTNEDKYVAFFYLTFFYAIFGIFTLRDNFNFNILINPYILLLTAVNTISQLAIINSYKMADKISTLQVLDYSKILFGVLSTAIILNEPILMRQIIGSILIIASIVFSNKDSIVRFAKKIKNVRDSLSFRLF